MHRRLSQYKKGFYYHYMVITGPSHNLWQLPVVSTSAAYIHHWTHVYRYMLRNCYVELESHCSDYTVIITLQKGKTYIFQMKSSKANLSVKQYFLCWNETIAILPLYIRFISLVGKFRVCHHYFVCETHVVTSKKT